MEAALEARLAAEGTVGEGAVLDKQDVREIQMNPPDSLPRAKYTGQIS